MRLKYDLIQLDGNCHVSLALEKVTSAGVALGVRGFSAWGKFSMNVMIAKGDKGKGMLGERVFTAHSLLGFASQTLLCLSLLAMVRLLPHPPLLAGILWWVPGDRRAPDQLHMRNRGKENGHHCPPPTPYPPEALPW